MNKAWSFAGQEKLINTKLLPCTESTHLKPPLGQEGDAVAVLVELLRQVEAHGADLIVDPPLVLIVQDGVGPVDLLKLLHRFWVVRVLVRVVLQCQLPGGKRRACWEKSMDANGSRGNGIVRKV